MPSIAPSKSTTTTRVAHIPYLNSAPFFRGLSLGGEIALTPASPREAGALAAAGALTAGLLPVADFFRLEDRFARLGRLGIAVRGRARSVMLFSRRPMRQLDGATIAVTEESSTSALLLRLLLERRYHLQPAGYVRGQDPEADALLLIGDEALRFQPRNTRYPFETDLAFEWWLWQHLPFVFAVWAVRMDAPEEVRRRLEAGLARALAANQSQHEAIAEEAAPRLGVPAAELAAYLGGFHYRFSQQEEEGIAAFRALLDESHLL